MNFDTETNKPKHPTYGTLDEFLEELKNDIKRGYYVRIGQQGAMNWFSEEYSKILENNKF